MKSLILTLPAPSSAPRRLRRRDRAGPSGQPWPGRSRDDPSDHPRRPPDQAS